MDKEIAEMKRMAAQIQKQGREYAKTEEGKELTLRMEFAASLLKALRVQKMTNAAFCRKIGMKSPQFSRIIQGDENITLAMVSRIVGALGYLPEIKFNPIEQEPAAIE